jgi:hypothetical protein
VQHPLIFDAGIQEQTWRFSEILGFRQEMKEKPNSFCVQQQLLS